MNTDSPENSSFTGKEKIFYSVFDPLDNDNSPKDHLWVPVPRKFDTSELGTLIFSSKLQKKSKTFGYWVTRYYFLFQDHLAYGSSKDPTKIKKYMPLEGLKAWLPRKKKKTPKQAQDHRLGLFRSNQFIELEMQDEQLLNEWVSHLRTRCIMVNFTHFYKMIGLLGKGSYGKVYLVENIEEKKRYAAKAIAKDHIVTRLLGVSSLFNEIGALKKLDHDKIVKLKEVFETPTSVYLIIEFIEGEELYTCLQRKVNFTEQESIILMKSILETLVYIHGKNIVHRDLKLENILITGSGLSDIKLIDFGLSVDVSEPFESKRGGTPGYIAPEVLNTENGKILISDKSDMFSLGCMLYRLLTGNKLFTGSTAKEILSRNKECYFNIGKPSVATLSNQAKDLLNKLLEKDPIKRISALEALNHPFFSQESIASCNELANTRENINIHSVAQYKFDVNHMKENNLRASTRLIDTNRNILSLSQFPQAPNSAAQIKPHAETILLDFTGHPTTVPLNIHGGECSVGGSLNPNSLTKIHNGSLVSLKSLNSDSTSPSRFSSHFKLEAKLRSFSNKSLFKKSFSKKLLSQAMTPATTLRTKNEGGGGFSDYASLCDLDKDKKFPVVAESIVQSRKLGSIGEAKDGDSSNSNTTH